MSALDKLKEQQSASETSAALMSRLEAVEQQTKQLTNAVNKVNGFLKAMDEAQTAALKKVSKLISQQQEQPSPTQPDDETRKRLSEIEKTLSAIAEQLTASGAVKLPDGEVVKRSDVDAYKMMTSLHSQQQTTTTALAELTRVVDNGKKIHVDTRALSDIAVKRLDERLTKAVEQPVQRIESTLDRFEQHVADIGTQKAIEATQRVEKVLDRADEVVTVVSRAERRVEALESRITWTTIGRICLSLLPLSLVLLVVGGLTIGTAYALGFGPLLGWAWDSFTAASTWWAKTLIALGTLSGVAAFAWLAWWAAGKIGEEYGRW